MDLYKIAFVEFFLIAILGMLIFGSNLKAFEYKITRFLRHSKNNQAPAPNKASEVRR